MLEINSLGQLLTLVKSNRKVTVIDFYADWCGPCQQIRPEYERMAQYNDPNKVVFCKCNVDRNRDCAGHFHVSAMPTFIICINGETIGTVRGGDLGSVQRHVDVAMSLIQAAAPSTSGRATGSAEATVSPLGECLLNVAIAKRGNDPIAEKDNCDKAYQILLSDTDKQPFGLLLLPYLASEAFSSVAVEALFSNIATRAPPNCRDRELIVNQILRFVVDVVSSITWDDTDLLELFQRGVYNLLQCPQAQPFVVQSPFFFNQYIQSGMQLERTTVLGALLGVGPQRKATVPIVSQRTMMEWQSVMGLFPAAEKELHSQRVYEIQTKVEVLAQANTRIVQSLLQSRLTREPTLRYLGRALQLNEDYQKTMHQDSPLSSRYFLVQLQSVLIEAALPMFRRDFSPSTIPPCYVLEDERNPVVVNFGKDVERIVHYGGDEEDALPTVPSEVTTYKPVVHLFFLAARAITLCATVFIDEHERDARNATHPMSPPQQQAAFTAEKCLYESLLGSNKLGTSRMEYLNGLALWLLSVMQVSRDGKLPESPPKEWNYLPQQLVDCVIRATQMAPVDGLFVDGMISLLLVLMGNTTYFPKPHTHALFPAYLIRLLQDNTSKLALERHPWFADNIVRGCIHCYIAVEKSTYEKVQVRYELSHCIKTFLAVDSLCEPVRQEFEKEGTVLERFSHMAVAEVNEAVDQLIETLTKMNHLLKSGADTSETATARASPNAGQGGGNGEGAAGRTGQRVASAHGENGGGEGDEESDDEEGEESADGPLTYHQLGRSLRSHIMLFNASIDMFIQLSVQFPRGVSQNMVAQQISQMLARSLVAFAGPKSKMLKIDHAERYDFRPREVLSRLVDCLTHFRRSAGFLRCLCHCGIPLTEIRSAMNTVVQRQLVSEDLAWKLSEMASAIDRVSREVDEEETLWDEAPDFALDALLSTPLMNPVALPADVKDLSDLVYVNRDTIHHLLLSENKHPFTKEYLDEKMVDEFNSKPEIIAARSRVQEAIAKWLEEAKEARRKAAAAAE